VVPAGERQQSHRMSCLPSQLSVAVCPVWCIIATSQPSTLNEPANGLLNRMALKYFTLS
jgi:hypothetical protein